MNENLFTKLSHFLLDDQSIDDDDDNNNKERGREKKIFQREKKIVPRVWQVVIIQIIINIIVSEEFLVVLSIEKESNRSIEPILIAILPLLLTHTHEIVNHQKKTWVATQHYDRVYILFFIY